ncbi:MAG: hypothetical protein ABL908_06745 [Hyphomicrobium sp.]
MPEGESIGNLEARCVTSNAIGRGIYGSLGLRNTFSTLKHRTSHHRPVGSLWFNAAAEQE